MIASVAGAAATITVVWSVIPLGVVAVIAGDLTSIRKQWDDTEARHEPSTRSRLRALPGPFFDARAAAVEATRDRRAAALHQLHDLILTALGFTPGRGIRELKRNTEHLLEIPVAAQVETGSGLLLVAIEAGLADGGGVDAGAAGVIDLAARRRVRLRIAAAVAPRRTEAGSRQYHEVVIVTVGHRKIFRPANAQVIRCETASQKFQVAPGFERREITISRLQCRGRLA